MVRRHGTTYNYDIVFMTARIAMLIADDREKYCWAYDWETLNMCLRSPETHAAVGIQFKKMFLRKFRRQDPDTMPPCYELGKTKGLYPLLPLRKSAEAAMPWKGLGQQPMLRFISVGRDLDGRLYSKKELKAEIEAVMDRDSPPICFLISPAEDWATWDAALFLRFREEEKREVHIVFLQTTIQLDHKIHAKGLNRVRDAIPQNGKGGEGFSVYFHYVLVLLIKDEPTQIPEWRHVLLNSKEQKEDSSWRRDNLRQYIMYVPMKDAEGLLKRPSED
jgi:hypothetical protein